MAILLEGNTTKLEFIGKCELCDVLMYRKYFKFRSPRSLKWCPDCHDTGYDNVKDRINEIFEKYKKDNVLWRSTKILSDDEFDILKSYLDGKKSGQWFITLTGFNDDSPFDHPIMLTQNQCEILIDFVHDNISENRVYRYMHAIGRNVLWTVRGRNAVFNNYHGHKPVTDKALIDNWKNKFRWAYNCSKGIIKECTICADNILIRHDFLICDKCTNMVHIHCMNNYITHSNNNKCFICKDNLSNAHIENVW